MSEKNEDYDAAPLGLYVDISNELLPIISIDIKALIYSKFAQVQLIHNYYNPYYDEYLDTSFKFPTGLYQVFDGIQVEMDGKIKEGFVGPKQEIKKAFINEVEKGSTVIKAEKFSSSSAKIKNDILFIKIGNIPPRKEIKVIFSFFQALDVSLDKIYKFVLPLTLTPRVSPSQLACDSLKEYIDKRNKLNCSINKEKIRFIQNENNHTINYYYNIDVEIHSKLKVENIKTKMKDNKVIIKKENNNIYKIFLDPSELHIPNEDFVLEYEIKQESLFFLEKHPRYENDYFFYYSFNPRKLIDEKIIKNIKKLEDFQGNFILLMDCSASMYGNKINMAKLSLIYFLKSLHKNGSKFNVIYFGSIFYSIFEENRLVNDENIDEAIKSILKFELNMGLEKKIVSVFEYIKEKLVEKKLFNRIFILTDGEYSTLNPCLESVKEISNSADFDCKFYSLGIGNGCRESLIKQIALIGEGEYEFVKNEEDIPDKIIYLLENSIVFCLNKFAFILKNNNDKIKQENKWFRKVSNHNIEFYAFFNDKDLLKGNSIICSFSYDNEKFSYEKKIEINEEFHSHIFHKMFLMPYINDKNVDLAIKYQVLTNNTSLYCLLQENDVSDEDLLYKKCKEIENIHPIEYQFEVKTLTGKTFILDYKSDSTILEVKKQIQDKEGIPAGLQTILFDGNQLEDNIKLIDVRIKESKYLYMVQRLSGGSGEILVLFNNEKKFKYNIEDEKEKISEMIEKICLKLEINSNIDNYVFYSNENILLKKDFNLCISNIFHFGGTLKIFNRIKMNISKEDNIIINQSITGLWKRNNFLLSLFCSEPEKWEELLNTEKNELKEKFNKEFSEEVVFNMFIIRYIIKDYKGKNRFRYILNKAIKGINENYPEINEEKIHLLLNIDEQKNKNKDIIKLLNIEEQINKNKVIIKNKYKIVERIGKGTFGVVYKAEDLQTKKEYAVKINLKDDESDFENEIKMLRIVTQLKNPYIINIIDSGKELIKADSVFEKNCQFIVMDYASKGELFDYISFIKTGLSIRAVKLIFHKILKGLEDIHKSGICHRNLELKNILMDEFYNPKICDFGLSTEIKGKDGSGFLNDYVGTLNYAPPEMYKKIPYNGVKADVFSLGVVLLNITFGKCGFVKPLPFDKYYKYIYTKDFDEYWKKIGSTEQDLDKDLKNLYLKMVSYEQNDRPTIKDIFESSWMKEIENLNETEYKNLEKEVYKEFKKIENIILDKKGTVFVKKSWNDVESKEIRTERTVKKGESY